MALVYVADRYTDYFVSGTSSASSPDYRTHYYIYYDDNQDVANNRTRIQIDYYLKMVGTRTPTQMSSGVYINGNSSGNYITIPQKSYSTGSYYLGSKDWYINHDSSGNGSYTFRGILYGGGVWTNQYTTGTTTYTLPTIPRKAYINNYSVWNNGLTQIGVWWTADKAIDAVQYSLSGGGWVGTSGNTFYINGLNPGTKYSVKIRVKATDSQLWTESGTNYATTTNIATLTSVPNNIDIDSPFTVNIARNGASNVSVGIYDTGGSTAYASYRLVTGTSYTFELTQNEKNALFGDMSTVNNKTYRIYVNTNDDAYRTYVDRTFNVVNANPIFSDFDYADVNPDTLDLTGDNQIIIKNYSNVEATITTTNQMETIKGATPKEYQLVVGQKHDKKPHDYEGRLYIHKVDNPTFAMYAIDSRDNSTAITKNVVDFIDYFEPKIVEFTAEREKRISTLTRLKINGEFCNLNFGAKNNIIEASYRFKNTADGIWIDGDTVLELQTDGNSFNFDGLIEGDLNANGFTASGSFDIQLSFNDRIYSDFKIEVLIGANPNLDLHMDGTSINGAYDDSLESGLQIYGNHIYFNDILLFKYVPRNFYVDYEDEYGNHSMDFETGEELRTFVSENSHTFINHCKVVAKKATILDCSHLFVWSQVTSIDLSEFNTRNVTNMDGMFVLCKNLITIDLTNFNTQNVTNMGNMFSNCESMEALDLTNFNTQNVTNTNSMFNNCESMKALDLTNFNMENVTNVFAMFYGCSQLETIYNNDDWNHGNFESNYGDEVFVGCTTLVGAIAYNSTKTDVNYANPDTGYFTRK